VPADKLMIDTAYQRDMTWRGEAHVERIAQAFDWSKFTPLIVSKRKDPACFVVIDGQHRASAAKARGLSPLPAYLAPYNSLAEEAAGFAAINGQVTPISGLHVWKAARAAGEPWAAELDRVCAKAGVVLLVYPVPATALKPGQSIAVAALRQLVNAQPLTAHHVLKAVTATRHNLPGLLNQHVIKALGHAYRSLNIAPAAFIAKVGASDLPGLLKASSGGGAEAGISRGAWLGEALLDEIATQRAA